MRPGSAPVAPVGGDAPVRAAGRSGTDPVAALALGLGVLVALALTGTAGRTVSAGALLALVGVAAAHGLAVAWRRRVALAPAVVGVGLLAWAAVAYARPTYGSTALLMGDEWFVRDRVVTLTRAGLWFATPILVHVGVRRVAGWRRASAGAPWRSLVGVASPDAAGRATARRGAAEALVGLAVATLTLGEFVVEERLDPYGVQASALVATVGFGVFALVVAPALTALLVVGRRDRAERELALQRQAVAAHLHDSVLQTFALIQRHLDDPERVRRLVRQQERDLRTWLSGREPDELEATVAGALRLVADRVEEEHAITIDLDVLEDAATTERHRPLLEAAREALRNAARHGEGAPVRVLAERAGPPTPATVVWVRDDGPGFDPAAVDPERRGIRDSIVGRMAAAGGTARIDTAPGAGTEVVLTLPDDERDAGR